jgi:hypothetical protein
VQRVAGPLEKDPPLNLAAIDERRHFHMQQLAVLKPVRTSRLSLMRQLQNLVPVQRPLRA